MTALLVVLAPDPRRSASRQVRRRRPVGRPARTRRKPPVVAAASDLKFALEEVAKAFTKDTGARVELVFSSSGTLTRQLTDGAPFELFMSADEGFVFKLADAGLTRDRGALYAIGRLALFRAARLAAEGGRATWTASALATSGGLKRFAIANPARARTAARPKRCSARRPVGSP